MFIQDEQELLNDMITMYQDRLNNKIEYNEWYSYPCDIEYKQREVLNQLIEKYNINFDNKIEEYTYNDEKYLVGDEIYYRNYDKVEKSTIVKIFKIPCVEEYTICVDIGNGFTSPYSHDRIYHNIEEAQEELRLKLEEWEKEECECCNCNSEETSEHARK